jgi:hypothetical protein
LQDIAAEDRNFSFCRAKRIISVAAGAADREKLA